MSTVERQARLMQVLRKVHESEKAITLADEHNQYTFEVLRDADKHDIKDAVEMMFDVKVESVRVLNVKGKRKTFGRMQGKRRDWKKAYVKLQEGHDIRIGGE